MPTFIPDPDNRVERKRLMRINNAHQIQMTYLIMLKLLEYASYGTFRAQQVLSKFKSYRAFIYIQTQCKIKRKIERNRLESCRHVDYCNFQRRDTTTIGTGKMNMVKLSSDLGYKVHSAYIRNINPKKWAGMGVNVFQIR